MLEYKPNSGGTPANMAIRPRTEGSTAMGNNKGRRSIPGKLAHGYNSFSQDTQEYKLFNAIYVRLFVFSHFKVRQNQLITFQHAVPIEGRQQVSSLSIPTRSCRFRAVGLSQLGKVGINVPP